MKNILETITHVSILEQNSTNVGLFRFMTVLCVNSEWFKEKSCWWSVEKVWCVCEVRCFWHHHAKAQIQKFWTWNLL